jgi:hypothetical protein
MIPRGHPLGITVKKQLHGDFEKQDARFSLFNKPTHGFQ